ncbi:MULTISPECIES: amino acid ABC transporter permease [Actinomadura]|jgi:polar amino acid transport system permease protein|uniref:Amino acid ABC transporter permease n=1 Tax=Actinomadura montaniterrae TaxID=1803903 RepID=A0A6L3VV94_9ACTN|nr:amino acid ABC transporter permease [Actinomadura montaniterrae]KAB2379784.1 amino acid ABC transporter permease [Actinomadura montaniterrae]
MTVTDETSREGRPEEIRAVPVRHWGRWVAAVIIAYIAVWAVYSVVNNPNFGWDVIGQNFTITAVMTGIGKTLELTAIAMVMGVVGGVLLAIMRLSPNPLISGSAWLYIWAFRGTPVLVQILLWAFIKALVPQLSIGIPFGPTFAHFDANSLITPFVAGCLGLGLNEAAYMSEIVRAGILSVDQGQAEAASALGMSRAKTMRRIVLPQAMRVIIPPTGNETISMLKTSSLVSVIAVPELLYSVQIIYGRTYQTIPLLLLASIWYLIMTSILTVGQFYLERYFGRGTAQRQTMLERLWSNLRARRTAQRTAVEGRER